MLYIDDKKIEVSDRKYLLGRTQKMEIKVIISIYNYHLSILIIKKKVI